MRTFVTASRHAPFFRLLNVRLEIDITHFVMRSHTGLVTWAFYCFGIVEERPTQGEYYKTRQLTENARKKR